ncbi:hypothetical protein [Sandaracinus amylolyticus]|uniref:Uncharacterized protein n=1 Tax=Sandaracinus amylolyticus TaxID=927083 RepID=A0A0F6W0G8_9BACT|nr:hypothetical protein [Sandaracinus amylolyticus]AKF04331.1 hypothetical protein DB32_001480 [Sandaracinus amylolyticus]
MKTWLRKQPSARDRDTVQVCIESPEVTDVTLSRTLGVGEAVYRAVANVAIPEDACFAVPFRL